jgi:ParB-like nuclease domain
MKIPVSNLLPNPFRNMEVYQIHEEKVESLISSFKTTGWWPIIIARKAGENGKYEQAFGHHRKEAYERHYGKGSEIEVIVLDLDDDQMLKMMAHENQEDWATSFVVQMETIQSVVQAFAEGRIQLEVPPSRARISNVRQAPSFKKLPRGRSAPTSGTHPYTAESVGKFLGWLKPNGDAQDRVRDSLRALEYIELGLATVDQFIGLTLKQAQQIIIEVSKTKRLHEEIAERQDDVIEEAQDEIKNAKEQLDKAKTEKQKDEAKHRLHFAKERLAKAKLTKVAHKRKAVTEPKDVADAVSTGMKKGEGFRAAPEIAAKIRTGSVHAFDHSPALEKFLLKVREAIWNILDGPVGKRKGDPLLKKIEAILQDKEYIDPELLECTADDLEAASIRAEALSKKFRVKHLIKVAKQGHSLEDSK